MIHHDTNINKRPLPGRGSAACFVRTPFIISYKHDSYVEWTL